MENTATIAAPTSTEYTICIGRIRDLLAAGSLPGRARGQLRAVRLRPGQPPRPVIDLDVRPGLQPPPAQSARATPEKPITEHSATSTDTSFTFSTFMVRPP